MRRLAMKRKKNIRTKTVCFGNLPSPSGTVSGTVRASSSLRAAFNRRVSGANTRGPAFARRSTGSTFIAQTYVSYVLH